MSLPVSRRRLPRIDNTLPDGLDAHVSYIQNINLLGAALLVPIAQPLDNIATYQLAIQIPIEEALGTETISVVFRVVRDTPYSVTHRMVGGEFKPLSDEAAALLYGFLLKQQNDLLFGHTSSTGLTVVGALSIIP